MVLAGSQCTSLYLVEKRLPGAHVPDEAIEEQVALAITQDFYPVRCVHN